mgnify:CR=1 FL=1
MILFIILIVPTIILGLWAQARVSGTYNKFLKVPSRGGISGAEAAAYVMRRAGVNDVQIVATRGHLNDHYDPTKKRLVLSEDNYRGTSLAALGVAAHEAGHAIQHKTGYGALKMRMALVPITTFASQALPIALIAGFFFLPFQPVFTVVACLYAVLTVFQLITLPVEFDASARAKKELVGLGIIEEDELRGVNKTLSAAAWTYVAAFISSLAWMVYYFAISRN